MWKPISNYEGLYEISDKGEVRSLDRFIIESTGKKRFRKGRALTKKLPKGEAYYRINLYKEKKVKRLYIHRLVAEAFIPNNDLNKTDVNHKDGDKLNNLVSNLEWCTKSENAIHSLEGKNPQYGERRYNSKLTDSQVIEIKRMLSSKSCRDIAKIFGVGRTTIQNIKSELSWRRIK